MLMEKDPTKPESNKSDDDDENTVLGKSSKKSNKTEEKHADRVEKIDADERKSKPAEFFKFDKDEKPVKQKPEKHESFGTSESKEREENEDSEHSEHLSEDEVHAVAIEMVNLRADEIIDELNDAQPDSPEEFEAVVGAAFLESLKERAESDAVLTEESVQEAFSEVSEDLSLDVASETGAVFAENKKDSDADKEAEVPEEIGVHGENTAEQTADSDQSSQYDNANNLQPNTNQPNSPSPPNPPNPPFTPPHNPSNQPPNSPNFPPNPPNYNPIPSPVGPNATPSNTNNSPNVIINNIYDRRRRGRDVLVGALLGYIIGRRGGRKRTEKKLVPKIDKLEKEVGKLHDTIAEAEDKIRKLARKTTALTREPDNKAKTVQLIERRQKRAEVKQQLERQRELLENPKVEKVGKFSLPALQVFRERRLLDGSENDPNRKRVEVMTTTELIEKLGDTKVDGNVVVQMYKKGRISESAMRKITAEYLRSGPYELTFRKELLPDPKELESKRNSILQAHNSVSEKATFASHDSPAQTVLDEGGSKTIQVDKIISLPRNNSHESDKKALIYGVATGVFVAVVAVILILAS